MESTMIYIIFKQYLKNGRIELIDTYSTFDDTRTRLEKIKDFHIVNYARQIEEYSADGSFVVVEYGKPEFYYYVTSRLVTLK